MNEDTHSPCKLLLSFLLWNDVLDQCPLQGTVLPPPIIVNLTRHWTATLNQPLLLHNRRSNYSDPALTQRTLLRLVDPCRWRRHRAGAASVPSTGLWNPALVNCKALCRTARSLHTGSFQGQGNSLKWFKLLLVRALPCWKDTRIKLSFTSPLCTRHP